MRTLPFASRGFETFQQLPARLFFSAKRPENCSCSKRKETNYNCEEHERFGQRQEEHRRNETRTGQT